MKALIKKVRKLHPDLREVDFAELLGISQGLYYKIIGNQFRNPKSIVVKDSNRKLKERLNALLEASC